MLFSLYLGMVTELMQRYQQSVVRTIRTSNQGWKFKYITKQWNRIVLSLYTIGELLHEFRVHVHVDV